MTDSNEQAARITATLTIRDPKGLHCRVAALLAYRLPVEAPHTEITLRTPEGREADPKMTLQTINLGARHSGVVLTEVTGPDAATALGIVRDIVEREHVTRAEVLEEIPADVGGEVGTLRGRQQRAQVGEDLAEWKSPGGFLFELADDTAPWVRAAMEATGTEDPGEITIGPDG